MTELEVLNDILINVESMSLQIDLVISVLDSIFEAMRVVFTAGFLGFIFLYFSNLLNFKIFR